jgi:hypothetical protein
MFGTVIFSSTTVHFPLFIFSRSFGIVLWEILTCAIPYDNIDPTAVMWGELID